jgi:hypothetical protein
MGLADGESPRFAQYMAENEQSIFATSLSDFSLISLSAQRAG